MLREASSLPPVSDSVRATYAGDAGFQIQNHLSTTFVSPKQPVSWRESLKMAVRDGGQLCDILGVDKHLSRVSPSAADSFPVFAPCEFIERMKPGDPNDPLLR